MTRPTTRQHRYQVKHHLTHRCSKCPKPLAKGSLTYCTKHRDAYNAIERKRYAKDPSTARQTMWQQRNIAAGKCLICGKKRTKRSKRLCTFHLDQKNRRARKGRALVRQLEGRT